MPTYQYECASCEYTFEALQNMTDRKLTHCEKCGHDSLVRLIGTGSGIIFKGTGFYETDYKKKDAPKEAEMAPKKGDQKPKEAAEVSSDSS